MNAAKRTNRLAITALICALVLPFFIGGILATAIGIAALDEIDATGEQGRGIAYSAIGLGFISILSSVVAVIVITGVLR